MHTNYYFLRQLAPALGPHLTDLRFMECFSQDRDEVVLVFAQAKGKINYYRPFYVKATLRLVLSRNRAACPPQQCRPVY